MKYESNNFQFEAEMPWESAGEGIVRQIMGYNDNLMMVKVKFETGAIGTPHTHPHFIENVDLILPDNMIEAGE